MNAALQTLSAKPNDRGVAASRRPWQMPDIVQYVAEFGLSLGGLQPEQVAMFVAARNLAPVIEGLEVPSATETNEAGETNLVERDTNEVVAQTAYRRFYVDSRLPADEMDVSTIRSVEDLPRIFPTQWLLEEAQPDLFYAKLAGQELLVPEWQRPTQDARESSQEVWERELLEAQANPQSAKQHAYVLLDTSRSMKDRDRRGTVARGLVLAFLLQGYSQRARLHLRPFTARLGELSSGTGRDDLRTIAQRAIGLPNAGQTRIQTALEQAVDDIRQAGPCRRASILLITDGISRITTKPFDEERLHTFLLGDLLENTKTAGTINTLREWSTTFHRLWTNRFAEILAPLLADLEATGWLLRRMVDGLGDNPTDEQVAELRRLHDNLAALIAEFRSTLHGASVPPEVHDLEKLLGAVKQRVPRVTEPAPAEPNAAEGHSLSFELFAPSSLGNLLHSDAFWAFVKRLLQRAWQRIRRTLRRWLRIES